MTGRHDRAIPLAWLGFAVLAPPAIVAALGAPGLPGGMIGLLLAAYLVLVAVVTASVRRLHQHAAQSEYLALHDPVTELPNRVLFHDRVHQALAYASRHGTTCAVMLIDLDRFKEVNDTLGHHNGDLLLHVVATRLSGAVRTSDSVARLGGDEFAVLVLDAGGPEGARDAAARVRAALAERIAIADIALEVEASIGIALHPGHGDDPEALLQRADVAMYAAKEAHTGVEVYSPERDAYSRERLELVAELRAAIEDGDLVVHFQPKADLATGKVVGAEALVRWAHPERGLLYPDAFVPVAENTGLVRPLTLHVLDAALAQCRAWRDAGLELAVAVNLSTRNLLDLTLPDEVARLLDEHGVPAGALDLEITETTLMADPPRAKAVLARLSTLGVGLAIDDFGTGYTSLSWLREMPVTSLKIDKSFVMNMAGAGGDAVIVRSTVQLGRSLGLDVVAEGVEAADAWRALSALGCSQAQGYFLSRPAPAAELTAWLRERDEAGELAA